MRRWIPVLSTLLMVFFLSTGCITTSKSTQNQQQISALEQRLASLEKRQAELESRFEGVASKSAEAYLATDQIQQEIAVLRGKFDQAGFNSKKFSDETKGLRDFMATQMTTVEGRLTTLEKKAGIDNSKSLKPVPTFGQAAGLAVAADAKDKKPEELYDEAYAAFKVNNLEKAKALFRQFVKKYPKHKLASNAQFNLAEVFYKQKDYESAILEYDQLVNKYPSSKLLPRTFLNLGFAFLELGSKSDARVFFEKVVADYPGTMEAKAAKKKLEMLK